MMRLTGVVAALATVLMTAGAYADDGARAYYLLPAGTNDFEVTTTINHLEIDNGVFDSGTVTPSYRRTIDVFGDAGVFLIGLPIGALSSTLGVPPYSLHSQTNPAQGDLVLGATLGIIGTPALSPMDYAQFKPGLAVSVATKLFVPTGDYDSNRLANLGTNRWSLQTSLPIVYTLGNSLVDPNLTTFEIVPSVQIFGDNKDVFGPPSVLSQQPLFAVEGHITHGFGQLGHGIWASLDGSAQWGGETSTDGVRNGDAQSAVSLGGTFGFSLSQSVAVRLSYEGQVYSNGSPAANRTFMATTAFLF